MTRPAYTYISEWRKERWKLTEYQKKVKKALIEREMTMNELAEALDVSRQAVWLTISGTQYIKGIAEKINRLLEIKE